MLRHHAGVEALEETICSSIEADFKGDPRAVDLMARRHLARGYSPTALQVGHCFVRVMLPTRQGSQRFHKWAEASLYTPMEMLCCSSDSGCVHVRAVLHLPCVYPKTAMDC